MDASVKTVELTRLALAFIPVVAVLVIYFRWTSKTGHVSYALARMLVQLLTVGYFLAYLLDTDIPWIVLAVLLLMIVVSSWIALNTVLQYRRALMIKTCLAIALGGGISLLIMSQWVLQVTPWYAAQYIIPLGGMVFANAMTSVSLCAERFFSEALHEADFIKVRETAFNASLIPMVNSLFAVGLVSLPGMMTGQILSGVSPLIAARYQIMVMCMLFAASGISSALMLHWLKPWFEIIRGQQSN
ncbi:ABC transporter permease [Oceanicoccus sp. KOV_DT_Chl]|uniref:ABC transporter permease n=1 Tax=Oceanicoccus sp. KOV_DT_Chl TaxID=1904639 RepID=UPI000C7E3C7F|nr:ABC transporter permease [Oceanicoccus sp. KOV_DT_Chl]